MSFEIPDAVIEYVRCAFNKANNKVSTTLTLHPSMHEESLDHILIGELTATPATFFAEERSAVSIETHWLGGRRMYGRWEIADIALFIILRSSGKLDVRKVALLQTKRLYSREIPTTELDDFDYRVGIGRIADKTDTVFPLSHQRAFSFDQECVFGAMASGAPQIKRIDQYMKEKEIPVYYGLYCPLSVPYKGVYPCSSDEQVISDNTFGCRVKNATEIHHALTSVVSGKAPALGELYDANSSTCLGWSLEEFVADEVLSCREGKIFKDTTDENLKSLFYERSAPITAAISITVDIGAVD